MFQIIDKELEREFHDVEDYFLDLFDASNQKWNIRINQHTNHIGKKKSIRHNSI